MTEPVSHIILLVQRGEKLSASQQQTLDAWLAASEYNRQVFNTADDPDFLREAITERELYKSNCLPGWEKLQQNIATNKIAVSIIPVHRKWWWAAAAVMVIAGCIWWLAQSNKTQSPQQPIAVITPGSDGAVLTLSNGQQIILDSLGNGQIATEDGSTVILQNNQLTYTAPANAQAGTVPVNTLTTPRGRKFRLILPDGTAVWLNAASSLKYPAVFNGRQRQVSLEGEAYFEVTPGSQPFQVTAAAGIIKVLGTSFNVSAYTEDSMVKTTLLQGAVAIEAGGLQKRLAPGQQAQLNNEGNIKVASVDTDEVIAWKENRFLYRSISVTEFLKIAARWYDVDIVYEGKKPQQMIWVNYARSQNLSRTLEILKNNGIRFSIKDKTIMILH